MTRTYSDTEALTCMLEEKEHDLELAVQKHQILLAENKDLSEQADSLNDQLNGLEYQLMSANDEVKQLRYDLLQKNKLLQFYCQDVDNEECNHNLPDGNRLSLDMVNIDTLQKKVKSLEEENLDLRLESSQLRSETADYKDQKKKVEKDFLNQCAEVKLQQKQLNIFKEELSKNPQECTHQKKKVSTLQAQVEELNKTVTCLTVENIELSKHLQALQESQQNLIKELGDKYDELLELQAENKELKIHQAKYPGVRRDYLSPSDSLASELETHLKNEAEFPKGYSPSKRNTTPNPCCTKESINSPGSGFSYMSSPCSHSHPYFMIPQKLQIVKPMEDSATLGQGLQLAMLNHEGIFEECPSVQIEGERKLQPEGEVCMLGDFEEDDDFQECPQRKSFNENPIIYIFIESPTQHRSSSFSLTPATSSSILSSMVSTPMTTPGASSTPKPRMAVTASMKRSTTSTYNMCLALAAILNERDLAKPLDEKCGMRHNQSYSTCSVVSETPYNLSTCQSSEIGDSTVSSFRRDVSASSSGTTTPTDIKDNGGIIKKIKSRFSFYEYFGGKGIDENMPDTSAAASTLTPSGSATSMAATVAFTSVDAVSPTEDQSLTKVLFTQGASTVVLGALKSFRRSGIL